MAHKIQIKRGNKADLPTLDAGEFGLCQDTNELFIGNNGNQKIFPPTALDTLAADVVAHKAESAKHIPIYVYERLPNLSEHEEGDIILVYDNIAIINEDAYEQGTISSSVSLTWEFRDATNRIRTITRMPITPGKYKCTFNSNYEMIFNCYPEDDGNYLTYDARGVRKQSPFVRTVPVNHPYFRLVFARIDGEDLTPNDIYTINPMIVRIGD